MSLSDCILAVAHARDRAAFAVLFSHFAPRLKTFFRRPGMLDDTQAEELAQETMILVWRKAALFDPGKAAASTWIFAIARNLRANALRRERRPDVTAAAEEIAFPQAEAADAPGAEERLVSAEREERLRTALRTLPPEQAQLLLLSYFGGRSHTEIGRELGVPLGTVKSRLRHALSRLRLAMDDTS